MKYKITSEEIYIYQCKKMALDEFAKTTLLMVNILLHNKLQAACKGTWPIFMI